jgi:hypothetical protein
MSGANKPLERLKYVNGQRLDAGDFRLEQDYHITLRRQLNKALYAAGIAAGLEVEIKAGDAHRLVVSPGLALDDEGREIILTGEREVQVTGTPNPIEGRVSGNYLVAEYTERDTTPVEDVCAVPHYARGAASPPRAQDGMARVRSDVLLKWRDTPPAAGDNQVVLAQVEMDAQCRARRVETRVRNYIGVVRPALSRSYALEGEKDINPANSKLIYFHTRGRRPDSVTLHLRAARFSTLFYSEMPRHAHDLTVNEQPNGEVPSHSHGYGGFSTEVTTPQHSHTITAWADDVEDKELKIEMDVREGEPRINLMNTTRGPGAIMSTAQTPHSHWVGSGLQTEPAGAVGAHTHNVSVQMASVGASSPSPAVPINNGGQLTFVDNLQIAVNGRNVTAAVLAYLNSQSRAQHWDKFGDGTGGHPLALSGTGPIQFEFIPSIVFQEDENSIELSVQGGGGRIIYNLYVE